MDELTVRMVLTPEQAEAFKACIDQWKRMQPTIYFLDICAISHIKTYLQIQSFKDKKHEESIQTLQKIDQPPNKVAYIAALMEKSSDQRSNFSVQEFVDEVRRDWDALTAFFKNASVVERWHFVETYAIDLFGVHPEQTAMLRT